MTEKFIIGLVGAPFGVKGFVKVNPLSGEIGHLLKLKSTVISKDDKERTLQIEEITPAPPSVLMRFAGIDSPEKAKTLNGAQLIAGREQAAPLGDNEFYIEDLKGLQVIFSGAEGENVASEIIVGSITDIIEGGNGELAEIKLLNGEKRLVPFRKEFFSEISPQKGRVVIRNIWVLE
ncbi:ribosome maturation factor RimM [Treponema sp. R80B11-R83G3]